jgi:hypothetical protein
MALASSRTRAGPGRGRASSRSTDVVKRWDVLETEVLARFRAIASQVWVLSWALDIGHAEHAAEARRTLGRATR